MDETNGEGPTALGPTSTTTRTTPLTKLVDRLIPGSGSALDHVSAALHQKLSGVAGTTPGRAAAYVLRGNEWLGHPAHPILVTVPIGAWTVAGWYDWRHAATGNPRQADAADAAVKLGVLAAGPAAVTGLAQFLDAHGAVRRETTVHAAMNNVALTLYVTSWALRAAGRRSAGRALACAGLTLVGVSGYLGGDLTYRHGMGVARADQR